MTAPCLTLRAVGAALCIAASLAAAPAFAKTGYASSRTFIVFAPDQALADEVLRAAEERRAAIARRWLGTELPAGVGRTMIHVETTDGLERCFTWAIDAPGRTFHKVYLQAPRERVAGAPLAHEIAHVVLATETPSRLPKWLEEGVACQEDDPGRFETRRRLVEWFVRSGRWPSLPSLLDRPAIDADDPSSYAAAASLTEFLLTCGEPADLFALARAAEREGWNAAVKAGYGFRDVADLERAWRTWETERRTPRLTAAPRTVR
jgi:hypothetical protein